MNEQEQRAYDLETTGNYDELNAWIHITGKAFIVGLDDPGVGEAIMELHNICPNGMFDCETVIEAINDAKRNAYFGQRSHVFVGATIIATYEAVAREVLA